MAYHRSFYRLDFAAWKVKLCVSSSFSFESACMLKEAEPKYERIIEHCDKALAVSPSNGKALFRKGISLYSLGQFSEALNVLKEAPSGKKLIIFYSSSYWLIKTFTMLSCRSC